MNNNFNKLEDNQIFINKEQIFIDYKKESLISKIIEKIKIFITNKAVLKITLISILVLTIINVTKLSILKKKIDNYEEHIEVIDKKSDINMRIYLEDTNNTILNNTTADKYLLCLNEKETYNNLPENIHNIINELNNYYNKSNNYFAFKYKDLYTGFTVSYNENQKIFAASTIKAPEAIYIYEMAANNKTNLNETLTYTSKYYNSGTGYLKNTSFNKNYTIKTLVNYSIIYSDNSAHHMLNNYYGRENIYNYWKSLGTNHIYSQNTIWGNTSAHDATIYMEELYNFYKENNEYSQELMNNFLNANPKFITNSNKYKIANKSGWSGSAIHDAAIVFDNNPYILVALSNLGQTSYEYKEYFKKVSTLAENLHNEYWKYKLNKCRQI